MLHVSPKSILQSIKRLQTQGYVFLQVRSSTSVYSLTPAGYDVLWQAWEHTSIQKGNTNDKVSYNGVSLYDFTSKFPHPVRQKGNTDEKTHYKLRSHGLLLKYPLKNKLPNNVSSVVTFLDHPIRVSHMNHWEKVSVFFQNFTVVLSPTSIILGGMEYISGTHDNIEAAEADILSQVNKLALEIEPIFQRRIPGFSLARISRGILANKILNKEWAYEHHPIGEKFAQQGERLLIRDREDGKRRVIVDLSKGFPEVETVHPAFSGEDMERVRDFTEEVALGKFTPDLVRKRIDEDKKELEELRLDDARKFSQVTDTLVRISESLGQIAEIVNRMAGGVQ
jgi:hypothetical protein